MTIPIDSGRALENAAQRLKDYRERRGGEIRELLDEKRRSILAALRNGRAPTDAELAAVREAAAGRQKQKARKTVELERCRECGGAGGVTVNPKGYVAGCNNPKCRLYVRGPSRRVFDTRTVAEGEWNRYQRELDVSRDWEFPSPLVDNSPSVGLPETTEDIPVIGDGGEGYIASALPDGWPVAGIDEDAGEGTEDAAGEEPPEEPERDPDPEEQPQPPATPPEEETPPVKKRKKRRKRDPDPEETPQPKETPAEEDDAGEEDAEGDAERYASFELVLDGIRYVCTPGEEGCDGCAFCLSFGKRAICAVQNEDDVSAARTLCGDLQGQWHKADAGEEDE